MIKYKARELTLYYCTKSKKLKLLKTIVKKKNKFCVFIM